MSRTKNTERTKGEERKKKKQGRRKERSHFVRNAVWMVYGVFSFGWALGSWSGQESGSMRSGIGPLPRDIAGCKREDVVKVQEICQTQPLFQSRGRQPMNEVQGGVF